MAHRTDDSDPFHFPSPIRIRDAGRGGLDADDEIDVPRLKFEARIRSYDERIAEIEAHARALREQRDEQIAHCMQMGRDIAAAIAADPDMGTEHPLYQAFAALLAIECETDADESATPPDHDKTA